jgi:hypothetical protein
MTLKQKESRRKWARAYMKDYRAKERKAQADGSEWPRPPRPQHRFGDVQQPGLIHRGTFEQPLTGEIRTAEIVRYLGSDVWKVRILETRSIFTRLRIQAEFVSPAAARAELTRFFRAFAMRLKGEWKETWTEPAGGYPAKDPGGLRTEMNRR